MKISQAVTLCAIFSLSAAQGKGGITVPGKEGLPNSLLEDLLKIPSIMHPNDPVNSEEAMASKGTGKFSPAYWFEDASLPRHTMYRPKTIPAGVKTPILLWGNGGCTGVGNLMAPFLIQVASQGITIISNGAAELNNSQLTYNSLRTYPQSKREDMKIALDWAEKQASTANYGHFDLSRVAAGGQSCGGFETSVMSKDSRVKTLGFFNSGNFEFNSGMIKGMQGKMPKGIDPATLIATPDASTYKVPAFYFLGCPTDIACPNGKRDFTKMANGVPSWVGSWEKGGHGGTYNEVNGGLYGVAASNWLTWVFFGDKRAADWFKNGGPEMSGWTDVQKKDLDKIKVI